MHSAPAARGHTQRFKTMRNSGRDISCYHQFNAANQLIIVTVSGEVSEHFKNYYSILIFISSAIIADSINKILTIL